MHRNSNDLLGYSMAATDGEVGKVEDFYFDDQLWIVVYLIVKTGNWLSGRKVLISPNALIKGAERPGTFPVSLTREQIKNSPDIDTDLPVYRQQEIALHQYYLWQTYWGTCFYDGGIWGNAARPPVDTSLVMKRKSDLHLRSIHTVKGYHIETTDGELGHVRDFIIDDETWQVEFLVIEMHSWLAGKKVLVARQHIKAIQWDSSRVLVDVTKDVLKNSPVYEQFAPNAPN